MKKRKNTLRRFSTCPLRYDADEIDLMLRPSGRLSNKAGYDSLASNYVHLDTSAQYTGDRSSATFQGALARDSSLLFIGTLT